MVHRGTQIGRLHDGPLGTVVFMLVKYKNADVSAYSLAVVASEKCDACVILALTLGFCTSSPIVIDLCLGIRLG